MTLCTIKANIQKIKQLALDKTHKKHYTIYVLGRLVRALRQEDKTLELIINKIYMAKRSRPVGRKQKSHSHKTKKRLEVKRLMLEARAKKRNHK